ncbi:hypothetical protein F5878DRAFT_549442, partial [Lentinula raphanica]
RKIAFKIIHSSTGLLPKWKEHLSNCGLDIKTIRRDVSTRWNSTHDMLESFLEMKEAIIEFVDRSSHQLNDLILSEKEWEVVEGLVSVLKEATLFFSTNGANLSSVIPAMDRIDEVFASGILNEETLSQPIRHALTVGKRTLNKYYALSDDSDLYRIAMGTFPPFLICSLC